MPLAKQLLRVVAAALINPELRVVAAADRDITRGRQAVGREAVKKERIDTELI
jgi:hypothetical protein